MDANSIWSLVDCCQSRVCQTLDSLVRWDILKINGSTLDFSTVRNQSKTTVRNKTFFSTREQNARSWKRNPDKDTVEIWRIFIFSPGRLYASRRGKNSAPKWTTWLWWRVALLLGNLHSGNLIMQWKMDALKMYFNFLLNMGIFRRYVSLPEGISEDIPKGWEPNKTTITTNQLRSIRYIS